MVSDVVTIIVAIAGTAGLLTVVGANLWALKVKHSWIEGFFMLTVGYGISYTLILSGYMGAFDQ